MPKSDPDKACISSRRSLLKYGLSVGVLPAIAVVSKKTDATGKLQATPAQTKGPFYPIHQQSDTDEDLTQLQGNPMPAKGEPINVVGQVLSADGTPLHNAMVEIWQADANGRYRHVRDPNPAPLDDNFQGWGVTHSDQQGFYRFKTIIPGAYPAGPGWIRPPHIHFKVVMENFLPLITQMYFPGNRLNDADLILNNLAPSDQPLVIAKRSAEGNGNEFRFNIYLKPQT